MKHWMKTLVLFLAVAVLSAALPVSAVRTETVVLREADLADKLKGSWVGQMAGVAWGAATEFTALGAMLDAEKVPVWSPEMINDALTQDDLYVEIPFMEAMKTNGVDCDVAVLGEAFKNTSFPLWHANNAARVNLRNGIPAPESGHYDNNRHCDDIDWQIEADFIGQMCPGLVNRAIGLAWKAGHVMNYGDGVYGGVYVAAMHAAAYTASNLAEILEAGRQSVPEGSKFRQVIDDITAWKEEGKSFEQTWALLQQNWGSNDRCPDARGAANALTIDAKLNAGYCLMGLLYGNGDFEETMRLAMICGQDSDCNPSTVGSILGNFYGFSNLPEKWTSALNMDGVFSNTSRSLASAIALNLELANEVLQGSGIELSDGAYALPKETSVQPPVLEQWPDQPVLEISTRVGRLEVSASAEASDASGIRGYTWDFGDGTTGTGKKCSHTYAKTGTYTVTCEVESNAGTKATAGVTILVDNNIASEGTPIVSETSPLGNGSKDIGVICDGVMPEAFTGDYQVQYDTYAGVSGLAEGYVGYVFPTEQVFGSVVFQEGCHFADGGWFANGTMKLQVRQNGEWTDVEASVSPDYPNSDNYFDFVPPLEIYTFTFEPVTGDGIRVIGKPGGTWSFFSVAELRVLAPIPEPDYLFGDVNGDGAVNAKDYMTLKRHILGTLSVPLTEEQLGRCDINGDGSLNAKDYVMLKRYIIGTWSPV